MTGTDIRQAPQFARFMEDLGWQVKNLAGNFVYLRKFPIIGSFAKFPRPLSFPDFKEFAGFIKSNRVFSFKIAPFLGTGNRRYKIIKKHLSGFGFKIEQEPFNPTTTIVIDLTQSEKKIFKSFSEAKRRGVRRAIKHGVSISKSPDIDAFIKIRQKQFSPMGFLITSEMKSLWKNFYPEYADLLLARDRGGIPVAGILLLYHNKIAYYWYASSFKSGKKMFAPTLLVWEAVKHSRKRGMKYLDFEGVYDARFPKASESWRGFTKFKEGFSDKKIVFMENFSFRPPIIRL